MFKCDICDRELKSKAGLTRHRKACSDSKPPEPMSEDEILEAVNKVLKPTVVKLEVMNEYYEGHPRRLIKLRGLLSRTLDSVERNKIRQMIAKL